jgi:hypothetical protein
MEYQPIDRGHMQGKYHPRDSESLNKSLCMAAILVVIYNGIDLSFFSEYLARSPFWIVRPLAWSIFFSTFGLIVVQYARDCVVQSDTLRNWLQPLIARIIIPVFAVVAISTLLIGPLASTAPPSIYFRDPAFFRYWLNIVGLAHFTLPGVFQNSVIPQSVNANLWAIPFIVILSVAQFALALRVRLLSTFVVLATLVIFSAELVAKSRFPNLFEAAGFVTGEGIGLPATAMIASLLTLALDGSRLKRLIRNIPAVVPLLYCLSLGAAFGRSQLASPVVTFAVAIAGALLVVPEHRTSAKKWNLVAPLLPVFLLFSYPLQQWIETILRESVNGWLLIGVPIPMLIAVSLVLSRPLARLAGDKARILAAWDIKPLWIDQYGSTSRGNILARNIPLLAISLFMILLFLAITLAVTPPKLGI